MKILFINQRYHPDGEAGPAFSVQALAEGVSMLGHDAHVLCINKLPYESTEIKNGVSVIRLAEGQSPPSLSQKIISYINKLSPNIVHTNWLAGFPIESIVEACKLANSGLVHSLREYFFVCNNGLMYSHNRKLCSSPCNECLGHSDRFKKFSNSVNAVVAVSDHCLKMHLQADLFERTQKHFVIANSLRKDAPETQLPSPSSTDKTRLGFLGRAHDEKGLAWLINRLNRFDNKSKLSLTVAATVQLRARQAILDQYPDLHIEWLGFTTPENLFSKIDWLVVPSLFHEPFGRVVIESYAHSTPVLASNLGGLPEIVNHGSTGFLFDPYRYGDFYQTASSAIANHEGWDQLRSNAFQASKLYSISSISEQMIGVYESVV